MALTYSSAYDLSNDPNFQKRVLTALAKVASDVYAESAGVANHAERAALAVSVSRGPDSYVQAVSRLIVNNATIVTAGSNASTTDQNIYDAISAVWNLLAGV